MLVSVHFKTVHLQSNKSYRFAFEVSVKVNVVFPVLVGDQGTAVQNQPQDHQAGVVYVPSSLRYLVAVHPLTKVTQFTDLFVRADELDTVGTITHSTAITQADDLLIVVSVACHSSMLQSFISSILSVHHT